MKVLLFTQYYWPETFLIDRLVALLATRGVTLRVVTGKPNYPGGRIFDGYRAGGVQTEVHDGVPVLRLPMSPRGQNSKLRLAVNYLSFILAGFFVAPRLVRHWDYDLVFVYAPSPLLQALPAVSLARRRNVPLVVWVQDLWPESLVATGHLDSRWVLAAITRVVRWIYRSSERVLVQSRAFVGPVAALCDRPAKVHYYPNLYQQPATTRPSNRALELAAELRTHFSVVFAGNLGSAQALDTLVDAARLLLPHTRVRLVLVGSGSQDAHLRRRQKTLSLTNLMLAGRFDASDMPILFEAAEALIVSLRADPALGMTIPSKVQAYLAAGRPILAALNGEGARIVDDAGAGLCSHAEDAAMLAANVLRLVGMPTQQRQRMGQRGQAYFREHFEAEALADELIEHFTQVISAKAVKT